MHFSSHKFCIVPEQQVTVFILATKIVRLIRSYYFNEQHFRVTISKSVPYKRIFTAASLSKSGCLRGLRSADFNGLWVTRLRFHPWLGVLDADISRQVTSITFSLYVQCGPRSEGWPHHGRTFSIYLCPLSFWVTLPRGVLSTSWCCQSRLYGCSILLYCLAYMLDNTLFIVLDFTAM